mmetsp:Transcript_45566/g.146704  ORF Transcript_45566/g.146704 Transcript_45566/m.146704 type:complete len:241 (-) Transcript_45566:492-1214(-)
MHICCVRKKASSPRPRNSFGRGAAGRLLSLTRVCAALLSNPRASLRPLAPDGTASPPRARRQSRPAPAREPRQTCLLAHPSAPPPRCAEMRRDQTSSLAYSRSRRQPSAVSASLPSRGSCSATSAAPPSKPASRSAPRGRGDGLERHSSRRWTRSMRPTGSSMWPSAMGVRGSSEARSASSPITAPEVEARGAARRPKGAWAMEEASAAQAPAAAKAASVRPLPSCSSSGATESRSNAAA